MKTKYFTFLLFLLFVFACTNPENYDSEEKDEQIPVDITEDTSSILYQIAKRWVLIERSSLTDEKNIQFDHDPEKRIITEFERNGYFTVFDYIKIDEKETKLEQRAIGQWEIYNNDELIMRYSLSDSMDVDALLIQKIEGNELYLKNTEKGYLDKFILEEK